MSRKLKTFAVVLLVALLPLRAVAAVTIGLCAMTQPEVSAVHQGCEELPAKPGATSCSICVEHCSSAAFAPSLGQALVVPAVSEASGPPAARAAPAFFPEHPDRPPLVLLR